MRHEDGSSNLFEVVWELMKIIGIVIVAPVILMPILVKELSEDHDQSILQSTFDCLLAGPIAALTTALEPWDVLDPETVHPVVIMGYAAVYWGLLVFGVVTMIAAIVNGGGAR